MKTAVAIVSTACIGCGGEGDACCRGERRKARPRSLGKMGGGREGVDQLTIVSRT